VISAIHTYIHTYIYIYIYRERGFYSFYNMLLMCFKLIGSYFYEFGMLKRICELIAKKYEFMHFMFRTLLLVIGFSPSYNFRM
jgi:hypothetical protein